MVREDSLETDATRNPRRLFWQACRNVRDLGGLPTTEGRRVRWGAVVRADDLCHLTPSGQGALLKHGIRTVIDLRGHGQYPGERHPYASPHCGEPEYLHLPLGGDERTPPPELLNAPSLSVLYARAFEIRKAGMARVLTAIARAREGGVVVHCHAGTDRAGLVVALLLSLADVADADIADDYALSGHYVLEVNAEGDTLKVDSSARAPSPDQQFSPPRVILDALASVRERYETVENYLLAGGIDSKDIDRLRERLVESAPHP